MNEDDKGWQARDDRIDLEDLFIVNIYIDYTFIANEK